MTESLLNGRVNLRCGDSREVLKSLPDDSIDSVVTDPPYALNFMCKRWDTGEVAFSEEFWAEVLRVLKPGGHVAAFGASRGYHRIACAIEDAGFEIRDSLMWVYGTGFPKGVDVSKQIDKALGATREVIGRDKNFGKSRLEDGKNALGDYAGEWDITAPSSPEAIKYAGFSTALKPAFEPIVLARKPLSEGTVAANVLRWGTGALNIDGCRVDAGGEDQRRPSSGGDNGLAGTSTFKIRARTVDEQKAQGRWPANVVHDGSDEVVGAFPFSKSGGGDKHPKKVSTFMASTDREAYRGTSNGGDSGSAARFFYSAKADADDRIGSKHPTVKPVDLMQWLCRLITSPGGTILDPFAGTGTTGEAAFREGFSAILIERESEYQVDIRRRLALCLSGPDERRREIIKTNVGDMPF